MFSTLRPCHAFFSFSHKPRRLDAAFTTRDRPSVKLYQQRERVASLKAGIGSAKPLNKPNQRSSLCRAEGRRRARSSPMRPQTLLLLQQKKKTGAQSRVQDYARIQPVKPDRQRELRQKCSGRRRGPRWINYLKRIRKPAGPLRRRNSPRRWYYVSLSPWPKYSEWGSQLSTTHSLDGFRWDWVSNFLALEIPKEMETWTSLDTDQVVRYYGGLRSRLDSAKEERTWPPKSDAEKPWCKVLLSDSLWCIVMLWCLKYQKKQGLLLLLATLKGRKYTPPRYVVADSLNFLAGHFLAKVPNIEPNAVEVIWLLTRKFIEGAGELEDRFSVPQDLIFLVLRHIDDSAVLSFFWLLGKNKAFLHTDTMLQFMSRLVDMGRIDLSIRLLGTIIKIGNNNIHEQVQKGCVKLLRARFDPETEYTARSNILAKILEMGVRPNIYIFNTILMNAGEGDDFAHAWKLYGQAKETDLEFTLSTYTVLLKGAALSCDDANVNLVINEIKTVSQIKRYRELLQNVRLLKEVLKAIYLVSPEDGFGAMLDFYKQYIDLRPLQELSLCGNETQALSSANNYRVQPDHKILSQMIVAYVRHNYGSLALPYGLLEKYSLYHQHVKENHPLIAPLARDDAVQNAFIIAFGKRRKTLPHCLVVVKHMLELFSQHDTTSDTVPYSAPTVHTWSALVAAYIFNGQSRAAEKVLEMMRERGIECNQVTWNTLVSGYSELQDANAAVGAVKRMEAAGFKADAYTQKGLGRLWLQDKVREALQTIPEEPSTKRGTLGGTLPPLSPEEQYEASKALEWESMSSNRRRDVRRYLEAEYRKNMGVGLGVGAEDRDMH